MLSPDGIKSTGVTLTPVTFIQTPGINKQAQEELLFPVPSGSAAKGRGVVLVPALPLANGLPPVQEGRRKAQVRHPCNGEVLDLAIQLNV